MSVGTELLNVPFPQMVRNLGVGIAEAQFELDMVSLKIARMMAGYGVDDSDSMLPDDDTQERKYLVKFSDGAEYSLLELGLTPTFYQFVDTVIELKMSISTSTEITQERKSASAAVSGGWFLFGGGLNASSVSASFASKYQYSAEGSSVMRTKIVPLPAPALLEERIRQMINARSAAPAPAPAPVP